MEGEERRVEKLQKMFQDKLLLRYGAARHMSSFKTLQVQKMGASYPRRVVKIGALQVLQEQRGFVPDASLPPRWHPSSLILPENQA